MAIAYESRKEIEIPDGVEINIEGNKLIVTGKNGTLIKEFSHPRISIKKENSKIIVICKFPKKKENALVGTWHAHILNMIKGVREGFEYKMKIVYSHFPMKATVKGNTIIIENFLGERKLRLANIVGSTKVVIKGSEIVLTGINKEEVGQSAVNIEHATKIKRFDSRVFQDGIYIVKKG